MVQGLVVVSSRSSSSSSTSSSSSSGSSGSSSSSSSSSSSTGEVWSQETAIRYEPLGYPGQTLGWHCNRKNYVAPKIPRVPPPSPRLAIMYSLNV